MLPAGVTFGRMRLRKLHDHLRPASHTADELGRAVEAQCGEWAEMLTSRALLAPGRRETAAVNEAMHRMSLWRLSTPALRAEVVDGWVDGLVDTLLDELAAELDVAESAQMDPSATSNGTKQ